MPTKFDQSRRDRISWKSRILALKEVPANRFVGYGISYLTEKPERFAIVPVGYADGFSRSMSNRGRVLIRGRRASVIGVVNMNALLVNITNVPGAAVGDEVVLIGHQKRLNISVSSLSELLGVLNYETLVRLPSGIPRTIVD